MAGVKVRDAQGNALEVSPDEAQAGFAAGRFSFDGPVRVVGGDNKTGIVEAADLPSALAQGWQVGTEAEAEAKKLRREASSATGVVKHGALAVGRGASLGLTDVLARGIGVSAEELEAGREALGGVGTGLEVAGGIAATAFTGGAGAAGAVGRGGGMAARLAGGGARAVATPSRLAARAGSAVERAVLGLGERTIGRRAFASATGEALDGALGGLGGAVSESVIHDKPLTAEALLGSALAGAVFSGGIGAGTGAAGGIARVLGGKMRRGDVGDDAIRSVLSRELGVEPTDIPSALVDAARFTDDSVLARMAGRFADTTAGIAGADSAVYRRVLTTVANEPKWARDVYNNKPRLEAEMAGTYQELLPKVQGALRNARKIAGGEAKYRSAASKMPVRADLVAPRLTDELRSRLLTRIDDIDRINQREAFQAYDGNLMRQARGLLTKATDESGLSKRVLTANDARGQAQPRTGEIVDETDSHFVVKWSSGSKTKIKKTSVGATGSKGYTMAPHTSLSAADSFRAFDRLKRDLGTLINWGPPRLGAATREVDTNKELRDLYDLVKRHLEDDRLFGDMGVAQREINAKQAASLRAAEALKTAGKGSGLGTLFNPDGSVNLRAAMNLTRQYGRMGGSETVAKLDEALEAQLDYLRTVEKHTELSGEAKASFREAEESVAMIREQLKSQRKVADFLADNESLRESEGNRSVSLGVASTVGPAVGGLVGAAALGPVGAAGGVLAGGVLRPYSTARAMASLLSMTGSFGQQLADGKGLVARLRASAKAAKPGLARVSAAAARVGKRVGDEARVAGRSGVRASAFQIGKGTAEERATKVERISARIAEMSSPEGLKRAMGPEFDALAVGAPEMAAEIEIAIQRAVHHLAAIAPRIERNPYTGRLSGFLSPRKIDSWLLRRAAIVRPRGVVDRVVAGTATREEVDTLRQVYPKHFELMVRSLTDAIADTAARDPLPHAVLVKLGRVLGMPLDPSQTPERIAAAQAMLSGGGSGGEQGEQAPRGRSFRPAGADAIDADAVMTSAQTAGSEAYGR
jgi:hypothetical protein